MNTMTTSLRDSSPYVSYAYGYPHKTAYRALDPSISLADVWRDEDTRALFGYVHIPFCEMRCGFCNLFTAAQPPAQLVGAYLDALERHGEAVNEAIPEKQFARYAIGGGTPTYLELNELERLFSLLHGLGIDTNNLPGSVETSPDTATDERLSFLRETGVSRISMGVQSFFEAESKAMGRPQRPDHLKAALERLKAAAFPVLNLDLIYGADGQTPQRFVESIDQALDWAPEELYLYPLYIRPLTGLAKQGRAWDDQRLASYRAGRERLLSAGYEQVSMRMFRKPGDSMDDGPAYCCQQDGMVGLGCGARSYTRALHYSSDYAVGRSSVREIIADYGHPDRDHGVVSHGFHLSRDEQARRYVISSLLQVTGLSKADYQQTFGMAPEENVVELQHLAEIDFAQCEGGRASRSRAWKCRMPSVPTWVLRPSRNCLRRTNGSRPVCSLSRLAGQLQLWLLVLSLRQAGRFTRRAGPRSGGLAALFGLGRGGRLSRVDTLHAVGRSPGA